MADHDRPLADGGGSAPAEPVRSRRRGRTPSPSAWLIAVGVLLLAALGTWLWMGSGEAPDGAAPAGAGDTTGAGASAPPPADTSGPEGAEAVDLPPVEASDSLVRGMTADLSEWPEWSSWLGVDGLVRRFVATVAGVAAGASPREQVEFLAPEEGFRVREPDGGTVVDPASYDRYDVPVSVLRSLDPEAAARLYRRLHPLFEEAHRELGFPEGSFDDAFARAVGRLLAVEVPDGPVAVVADGGVWDFRDPELEALSPAAKHLLRLGPENARRVQAWLRELADASGIEPVRPDARP